MKKRNKTLIALLSASLMLGAAALFSINKSEFKEVEATRSYPISGTFARIRSHIDLNVGDKVIFVGYYGEAMDDIWGNPGYLHGDNAGVNLSNDRNTATLTNSNATIFTVEAGSAVADAKLGNSYAFRADSMRITGQKKSNIYVAHNEKDYYGDNTFANIAYFKDRDVAVEVENRLESSWYIEFTDEYDEVVTHIRNAKAVRYGDYKNELRFTYDYAPRFCSNSGLYVNLYKLVDETIYGVSINKKPTKTDYHVGDHIDLTGLIIEIHSQIGDQYVEYTYENYADFTYSPTAYGDGEVLLPVKYNDWEFVIPINVSKPSYSATIIGQLADYRGSYMLVEEGGHGLKTGQYNYGFDFSDSDVILDYSYEYGVYSAKNEGEYSDLRLDVIKDNNGYHLKNANNYYLDLSTLETTNSSTPVVVIEHTNSGELVGNSSGKYLCYLPYEYKYGLATLSEIEESDNYVPVVLCKYDLTSAEQTALDTYVSNFISTTNVCVETGTQFLITENNWTTLSNGFSDLSATVQAEIINTTYEIGQADMTDLQFAMSRYDYIYSKYHTNPNYTYIIDFIGRSNAGTMKNSFGAPTLSPIQISTNNNVIIAVIIAVSLSSLLIASFVIYKKKRIH